MRELYVGLISGTSIDGIDAALVDFSDAQTRIVATHCESIPEPTRQQIRQLSAPGNNEIELLGSLDRELGQLFAIATQQLLEKCGVAASEIRAIGSHGQTVRHQPPTAAGNDGFSLQIGDPHVLAAQTGITTVADFRRRDMAAGGQGAPFAPAFHQAIAPGDVDTCCFLNLGGIANLTLIHRGELLCGFDTGPANGLMDAWIRKTHNQPYDKDGAWAASGHCIDSLLENWLADPYFAAAPPKSTGPELFNLAWASELNRSSTTLYEYDSADVQATLLALSAQSIANAVSQLQQQPEIIYCCGGGARNKTLITTLDSLLPAIDISNTGALGIDVDFVEAALFAWLARKNRNREATDLRAVTGARYPCILGSSTT